MNQLLEIIKTEVSAREGKYEIAPLVKKRVYFEGKMTDLYSENPLYKQFAHDRDIKEALTNAGYTVSYRRDQKPIQIGRKRIEAWKASMEPWKSPLREEEFLEMQSFEVIVIER